MSALGEADLVRHYLVVSDDQGILGLWEAATHQDATRLKLRLKLQYPACRIQLLQADSYEALKASLPQGLAGVVAEAAFAG